MAFSRQDQAYELSCNDTTSRVSENNPCLRIPHPSLPCVLVGRIKQVDRFPLFLGYSCLVQSRNALISSQMWFVSRAMAHTTSPRPQRKRAIRPLRELRLVSQPSLQFLVPHSLHSQGRLPYPEWVPPRRS